MYETIILGVACLSAPLFAKYAGYELRKKPFDMVGVAGLFFLLAAAFSLGLGHMEMFGPLAMLGEKISRMLGVLSLLIGALTGAYLVVLEPEHAK